MVLDFTALVVGQTISFSNGDSLGKCQQKATNQRNKCTLKFMRAKNNYEGKTRPLSASK